MFQRDGTKRNNALGSHESVAGSIGKSLMRTDARLNELQRAIGRYLAAEQEPVQPIPDRLVALLRKIEQP
jgi:hypothetical protein